MYVYVRICELYALYVCMQCGLFYIVFIRIYFFMNYNWYCNICIETRTGAERYDCLKKIG